MRPSRVALRVDLMIASVALAHDLTLVTHNTADFQHIPDLRNYRKAQLPGAPNSTALQ